MQSEESVKEARKILAVCLLSPKDTRSHAFAMIRLLTWVLDEEHLLPEGMQKFSEFLKSERVLREKLGL